MHFLNEQQTLEVKNYLKKEINENFSNFKVLEFSDSKYTVAQSSKHNIEKIPEWIKTVVAKQEKGINNYYVFTNKDIADASEVIVVSNDQYTLLYEPYHSRFVYFDSEFGYIGSVNDILGQNPFEDTVQGKNFYTTRKFDVELRFATSQFKSVGLCINETNDNFFNVSAAGKNKVKSVTFKKGQIKADVVNCFIKNILFDLDGNIKSVGIKNKLSKELTLSKTQFDVSNYSELINLIEQELQMYNLINDKTLDIINQNIFDSQITFVRNIITQKEDIKNTKIYKHINNIKDFFHKTDISVRNYNFCGLTIDSSSLFSKYSFGNNPYHSDNESRHNFNGVMQTLGFLASLSIKKLDFDYFINDSVIESFKELNSISFKFSDSFKNDVEQNKNKNKNKI